MNGRWKPSTTPAIRGHRMYLNQIRFGDDIYTIDEANQIITDLQLAVARQEARSRSARALILEIADVACPC